ncbi:MAG: electron transfer flavoprotein subunit alpha/FixB family protein [Dehalococcoidia bacterium]|nr:electron transfer flavoprotein subunit alpha/FixB family protein [Dehalococcoidia bacterium]
MSNVRRVITVLNRNTGRDGANAQLIGAGRRLASAIAGHLTTLTLEAEEAAGSQWIIDPGADEVVRICAPWLSHYQPDAYVAALAEACARLDPDILLLAHDAVGREVAPRLAARLGAGLVTECTSLGADPNTGEFIASRPCFSGKAVSEWTVAGPRLTIATLRRQPVSDLGEDRMRAGNVETISLALRPPLREKLIEEVVPPPGQVKLEDAGVVVAVGRGVGSEEAFREHFVEGLASAVGAACGGSRGAVDMGIISPELQIGLTGRVVSPRLYIAVGLSGSPQHMAGCSGAGTIVAVNTDPQAPIFGYAHYGVVGDYRRVIPSLTQRLKKLAAKAL